MIPNHSRDLSLHCLLRIQSPRRTLLFIPPCHNDPLPVLQRDSHKMVMIEIGGVLELARVNAVSWSQAQEGGLGEGSARLVGNGVNGKGVVAGAEG